VNKEDREKKRETLKEKKLARIEAKKTELHRLRAIAARDSAKSRERADELKKSLRRLNHQQSRCPYCDGELINKHLDHIIPLGRGGLSVPENLVFVCGKCNEEKSSDTLTMFVKRRGFDRDAVERRLSAMGKVF
jgi:5-methylcytosine-specific restriction endonuclease McrA